MLKSSSLCLYSSNLGTFWLKIEQFWPFDEISIFSNGGHLGYRTALTDTILKRTHPGTIPARFGLIWFSGFRGEDLNVIFHQNFVLIEQMVSDKKKLWEFPIGLYVKLSSAVAAILVGVLKCRTQFWKRTTQESFQQRLVETGSVVSEEKIFFKFHPPFFYLHNRSK